MALGAAVWVWVQRGRPQLAPELVDRVSVVEHVLLLSQGTSVPLPRGVQITRPAEVPELSRLLRRAQPEPLVSALHARGIHGVLTLPGCVPTSPPGRRTSVSDQIRQCRRIKGLKGTFLSRNAAFFRLEVQARAPLPQRTRDAVAHVTRRILAGVPAPKVASFPPAMRQLQNVEVMVLLRRAGSPRLWRSARASSLARGLITAAVVARQRWIERQRAMGEALFTALPKMDVEIMILAEDGTLGTRDEPFVNAVFKPEHGVGYERLGNWRYVLPGKMGNRAPMDAYGDLFEEYGLPRGSLDRADVRPYRLASTLFAVSPAETGSPVGKRTVKVVPSPED